jgi:integrase
MVDAMKWENFTAGRVAGFKCGPGKNQAIHWDGKQPGLGLRVTATGARSYIFEATLRVLKPEGATLAPKGKTIRITIGDTQTYSVSAAQKIAADYKAQTDKGIDPRQVEADRLADEQAARDAKQAEADAKQTEAQRQGLTLAEVWPLYVNARKSKWSAGHLQNHITLTATGGEPKIRGKGLTVAGPMASLMPLALADLTSERIAAWLEKEAADRPTNAAQSYRLLRAFIRWAADIPSYRGIVAADAYSASKVREAIPKSQAADGDGLQREQLPAWFDAVRKIGNQVIAGYLQALLLTGARREELAGLRWADVDFKWCSMTIKDKVEGTRTIPLTPYVSHLIAALPRRNEYVFSSPSAASGYIEEPRIAHTKALAAAGLPHVSLQGLRRSFGTLCEWVEMPSGISAQIMGHKPSALAEKHYRRRPLDLLRVWHIMIEAWMLEQAGIDFVPAPAGVRVVASTEKVYATTDH